MPPNRRKWLRLLVLGFWMAAAGPTRAEDAPANAPAPPARSAENAGDESPPARVENAPDGPPRPAVKPSAPAKKAPRARKPFRPSEEIHVDKAVDFPADI